MIFYNVTPREIRDLSLIGGAALVFFAIGSFALSASLSLYEGHVFADAGKMTPVGSVLSTYGALAAIGVAIAFYGLGIAALIVRSRDIDDIKQESKKIVVPVRIPTSASSEADSA